MVDDKGGCPWVDIACIPIIPQHQLLIHINRGARPPLIITRFPPKSFVQSLCTTPTFPLFHHVSPSLNIIPGPTHDVQPARGMVRLQRKADDSKGPDVPPEGWKKRGKGRPWKGGKKTTPTYGWDDNVCWVFVWGVSVWNQKMWWNV